MKYLDNEKSTTKDVVNDDTMSVFQVRWGRDKGIKIVVTWSS